MNKMRRKEIYQLIARLNNLKLEENIDKIIDLLSNIIDDISMILNDEECYKDNIPENLQNGSRYEESEYACDCMYDAISELEYIEEDDGKKFIMSTIDSAIHYLNDAI